MPHHCICFPTLRTWSIPNPPSLAYYFISYPILSSPINRSIPSSFHRLFCAMPPSNNDKSNNNKKTYRSHHSDYRPFLRYIENHVGIDDATVQRAQSEFGTLGNKNSKKQQQKYNVVSCDTKTGLCLPDDQGREGRRPARGPPHQRQTHGPGRFRPDLFAQAGDWQSNAEYAEDHDMLEVEG